MALTGGALSANALGAGEMDPATRALGAGADMVIEKPFLGHALLSPINKLLDGARAKSA